jgi:radical SAM superfamily enzyme with C-terminal helix-hairpin-helix motif
MVPRAVILDCYTDEPSGYGVRPYLGTHQIHLSQALSHKGIAHTYLTIDDLRYAKGVRSNGIDNIGVLNITRNAENALDIVRSAQVIYIVMGRFVQYDYFACKPPTSDEVSDFLADCPANKVLFYVMGTSNEVDRSFNQSQLAKLLSEIEVGNTYRRVLEGPAQVTGGHIAPNYDLLDAISSARPSLIDDLLSPVIAEIETGTGCNTPTCYFCIESARSPKIRYRSAASIVKQVKSLYDCGVRHFRLGRQPNFFHYGRHDVGELERLLAGIRDVCPELKMLHIDNVNIVDVVGRTGRDFARLVVEYCTSGNITPFGIESFDDRVRAASGVIGSASQVMEAIAIINEYGAARGPDGLPRLLPGINLIYGLKGQTAETHFINVNCLQEILRRGYMTRRLYYRSVTRSTGVSFGEETIDDVAAYQRNFEEIVHEFVLPMQELIYPKGGIIRDLMEVRNDGHSSQLRTFGTCSSRYRVCEPLERGFCYDVRVLGNGGYRLLDAEVVAKRSLAA